MMHLLREAGPLLWPLALCSLVATTITIERLIALRRGRVLPREIVEVARAMRPGRDPAVALDVCRRNAGPFAEIVRAGLEQAHVGAPWEVMRDALLDAGRRNAGLLERHLVWLQTVAQAAPLLGLLGTVVGMIRMFGAMSLSGLGDPQALSGGIREAMITTALGLAIGIPALVAYNLLVAKAESLVTEMETHASRLVARMRPEGAEGGGGPGGAVAAAGAEGGA
jgi:biopolymer transport protein ExbB